MIVYNCEKDYYELRRLCDNSITSTWDLLTYIKETNFETRSEISFNLRNLWMLYPEYTFTDFNMLLMYDKIVKDAII